MYIYRYITDLLEVVWKRVVILIIYIYIYIICIYRSCTKCLIESFISPKQDTRGKIM